MILQQWGLGQGPYPVKFRIKCLSPADDDLRVKIDGNIVENTLLNVAFYSGSIILPSGTLNNGWQTQGFREIEISESQAISRGSPWSFNSLVNVDVSNTGDGFQTGPGQWRTPMWTASVHFSDGRISYKIGGRNDPGFGETASLLNPVYHENGYFYLNLDSPTVYSDLVIYAFDSSSFDPTYQSQDFSGSMFISGSKITSSLFTGSVINTGGSNATSPILSVSGYNTIFSTNSYCGFDLTNLTGQTYDLKTFEFDMGVGSGNLILEGFYSFNNFLSSSSFFRLNPSLPQCMHFSYPLTESIYDGQKIGIRLNSKSQTGTGIFRIDNVKLTGIVST